MVPTLAPYAAAHKEPKGPGDARPTPAQVVKDQGLEGKLSGSVALVTGCTSGIGVETARGLLAAGARVFITARDKAKAAPIVEDLRSAGGQVDLLELDLASLASVRRAAEEFLSKSKRLNVLVTNAGVMACPESATQDGFEVQIGTNHLGHFLLAQLLLPALEAASTPERPARFVALSSSAHQISPPLVDDINLKATGYNEWLAYGHSKSANIWHASEFDRRYAPRGVRAFAVHPGGIMTELARHMPPEGIKQFMEGPWAQRLKSPAQGAATSVWAALAGELGGQGGLYLEDVSIAQPRAGEQWPTGQDYGFSPHAYDEEGARRLWEVSEKLVGLA